MMRKRIGNNLISITKKIDCINIMRLFEKNGRLLKPKYRFNIELDFSEYKVDDKIISLSLFVPSNQRKEPSTKTISRIKKLFNAQ